MFSIKLVSTPHTCWQTCAWSFEFLWSSLIPSVAFWQLPWMLHLSLFFDARWLSAFAGRGWKPLAGVQVGRGSSGFPGVAQTLSISGTGTGSALPGCWEAHRGSQGWLSDSADRLLLDRILLRLGFRPPRGWASISTRTSILVPSLLETTKHSFRSR